MEKGWQSGKTLVQCNAYMLKYKLYHDVTFHVGPQRHTIKAHKFPLLSRSPVFCEILSESGGHHLDDIYTLPDVDPEAFNNFLSYIYCDEVDLTSTRKTVIPLLHVARKFQVGRLMELCMAAMMEDITEETVCYILEEAHKCSETKLQTHCLQFIYAHAHAAIKSTGFVDLCSTCVKRVIESDHLRADETFVYEAMVRWATQEVKRKRQVLNDDNRRRALGDLRFLIRFPVMDIDFFTRIVSTHNILDKDEKIAMFQFFHSQTDVTRRGFNTLKRNVEKLVRFTGTSGYWSVGSFLDAIQVKVSQPILLDGVLVYGCSHGNAGYDVTVAILDENSIELQRRTSIIETNANQELYDVIFNSPQHVTENTWYTVTLWMSGPQTKRGIKGSKSVEQGRVQFEFRDSHLAHNCSTETEGQLPGLVCHLPEHHHTKVLTE